MARQLTKATIRPSSQTGEKASLAQIQPTSKDSLNRCSYDPLVHINFFHLTAIPFFQHDRYSPYPDVRPVKIFLRQDRQGSTTTLQASSLPSIKLGIYIYRYSTSFSLHHPMPVRYPFFVPI